MICDCFEFNKLYFRSRELDMYVGNDEILDYFEFNRSHISFRHLKKARIRVVLVLRERNS